MALPLIPWVVGGLVVGGSAASIGWAAGEAGDALESARQPARWLVYALIVIAIIYGMYLISTTRMLK